jgi:hypothetical protein
VDCNDDFVQNCAFLPGAHKGYSDRIDLIARVSGVKIKPSGLILQWREATSQPGRPSRVSGTRRPGRYVDTTRSGAANGVAAPGECGTGYSVV